MSERPKVSLQESDELPRDVTALFSSSLYHFDAALLPNVISCVLYYVLTYCTVHF